MTKAASKHNSRRARDARFCLWRPSKESSSQIFDAQEITCGAVQYYARKTQRSRGAADMIFLLLTYLQNLSEKMNFCAFLHMLCELKRYKIFAALLPSKRTQAKCVAAFFPALVALSCAWFSSGGLVLIADTSTGIDINVDNCSSMTEAPVPRRLVDDTFERPYHTEPNRPTFPCLDRASSAGSIQRVPRRGSTVQNR